MLDKNFSLEQGLQLVGNPVETRKLVLTAQDDAVKNYRASMDLFVEAVRTGDLVFDPEKESYHLVRGADLSKFGSISDLYASLPDMVLSFLKDDSPEQLRNLVSEMVLNAVEHGTDYCQKGVVAVEGTIGQKKQLWVVSQPQPGVNFFDPEQVKPRDSRDEMYRDDFRRVRGAGLLHVKNSTIRTSTVDLPENRWGVVMISSYFPGFFVG